MIIDSFRIDRLAIRRRPIRHRHFAVFETEPAQRPFERAPHVEPEHLGYQVECIAPLTSAEV
jgi:hypothetical protein